jgi:hypothetical protein
MSSEIHGLFQVVMHALVGWFNMYTHRSALSLRRGAE